MCLHSSSYCVIGVIPVNVSVNGLYICVCLEYLLAVAEFFTKGLPQAKPVPSEATKAAPTTAESTPTEKHVEGEC